MGAALSEGADFFDSSPMYGEAERALGVVVMRHFAEGALPAATQRALVARLSGQ